MYQSARTTPLSHAFLLAEADRIGVTRAARNMGVSRNTVYRWRRRPTELAKPVVAAAQLATPDSRAVTEPGTASHAAFRRARRW